MSCLLPISQKNFQFDFSPKAPTEFAPNLGPNELTPLLFWNAEKGPKITLAYSQTTNFDNDPRFTTSSFDGELKTFLLMFVDEEEEGTSEEGQNEQQEEAPSYARVIGHRSSPTKDKIRETMNQTAQNVGELAKK